MALEPLNKQVYDRALATYGILGEWEDVAKQFAENPYGGKELDSYYGDAFNQYEQLQKTLNHIKEREREEPRRMATEKRQKAASPNSFGSWMPDEPIYVDKIGRDERVTVKYLDGKVKQDVKYESVEADMAAGKAVLV